MFPWLCAQYSLVTLNQSSSQTSQRMADHETLVYGTCNCGAIKISLPKSSFPSYCGLCHCANCRASSGSLYVFPSSTSHLLSPFSFSASLLSHVNIEWRIAADIQKVFSQPPGTIQGNHNRGNSKSICKHWKWSWTWDAQAFLWRLWIVWRPSSYYSLSLPPQPPSLNHQPTKSKQC